MLKSVLLLLVTIFIGPTLYSQVAFVPKIGVSIPGGKELRRSFDAGVNAQVGFEIPLKKFTIAPNLELGHYINKPKHFEHLFLWSGNIDVDKKIIGNLTGRLSLGYTYGKNIITQNIVNLSRLNLLIGSKQDIGTTSGLNFKAAFTYAFKPVSVELGYRHYNPYFKLDDALMEEILSLQKKTIYGDLISLSDQQFNLGYFYILLYKRIIK